VGCGEGYYLAQLALHLTGAPHAGSYAYLGIDSAKHAVQLAGRRCPGTLFVVADVQEGLPVAGSKMHVLLNIFAPRNIPEFARVLTPGGLLLTVIPSPKHLLELRTALNMLEIEEHKLERLVERLGERYACWTTRCSWNTTTSCT
jgi:23S rRNA (guanine745-N1)-methyltransferase